MIYATNSKNEIILYHSDELASRIEVRIEEETNWLTQQQIVELFDSSKANISDHIKHIFDSGELEEDPTVRKFRTVQKEGRLLLKTGFLTQQKGETGLNKPIIANFL